MDLDERQQQAVDMIVDRKHGVGIVTGGPGCGKTTCMKIAMERLLDKQQRVLLLAPTGKAARRLSDVCGMTACTIHRALGFREDGGFEHDRHDPLDADVVIVDEASMLDTELGASLFDALDERRTSIFLVGDINQLPSVGPGYVLGDAIATGLVPVVRLETLHRAAQSSWMCRNAPRILAGDLGALELEHCVDFQFMRIGASDTHALIRLVQAELNEAQRVLGRALTMEEAFQNTQVLIPQKKGPLGVHAINAQVQAAVHGDEANPREAWHLGDESRLWSGDKVIQTKNDYHLGIMNGEQGIVVGQRDGGAALAVDFDGDLVSFNRDNARQLELSYAMTVHKSQGSEYPLVLVVCHSMHGRMLSRQLLYTAVTRAKQRLVIAGDEDGLARALANNHVQDRETGLRAGILAEVAKLQESAAG